MVRCKYCAKSVGGIRPDDSSLCCELCGRVLETDHFSHEPTFMKNSSGQSQLSGNFVRTIQSDESLSRDRTLNRVHDEMSYMWYGLTEDQHDYIVQEAMIFYKIALERNFTKGRRTEQVQAACLYISCREKEKPYLLIDFSYYLQINVYVLGAVFLQLCRVLRLEEHPIVQSPVDPSLFMLKFSAGLLGKKNTKVSDVAIRIITKMKRDWMQTGRKPSGICGAALYIAAKAEGFKCSKSDITRIVHICDATLTKRLVEFESTESASLTIEELNNEAMEHKESVPAQKSDLGLKESGKQDLLCVHKNENKGHQPFALGLCKICYDEFVEVSGGLEGGADPPAFQRAERERMAKASAEEDANNSNLEKETDSLDKCGTERLSCQEPDSSGPAADQMDGNKDELHNPRRDDSNTACDESETVSDIDDLEVDAYIIHDEKEKHIKKIFWENMNREYLEEQAAKEAAAREASEANCSQGRQAEKEFSSAVTEAVAKSRKERQQKRSAVAKSLGPAQTAAEATHQMLTKKRMGNKICYDKLKNLFEESVPTESTKKQRIETNSDDDDKRPHVADKEPVSKDPQKEIEEDNDEDPAEDYDNDSYNDDVVDELCDYDDEHGLY